MTPIAANDAREDTDFMARANGSVEVFSECVPAPAYFSNARAVSRFTR
jgi:hypothetical protein